MSSSDLLISNLLPEVEPFSIIPIQEGASSRVFHIKTKSGAHYIYRQIGNVSRKSFKEEIMVIKKVAGLGLGPYLFNYNCDNRSMLLQYIEHKPWPEFSKNKTPYQEAMRDLRKAHLIFPKSEKQEEFSPFSSISQISRSIVSKVNWLPDQFSGAVKKINQIYEKLKPWLKKNAVLCHGDFHKGNVLNGKKVSLIDWTTVNIGHPFFDVAKFSLGLKQSNRLFLLKKYLGHDPSNKEIRHFTFIDLALLMVIVVNRFRLAEKAIGNKYGAYTKKELNELLSSSLPSFLSVKYTKSSPKLCQFGAICALQEFLKRSKSF